MELKSCNRIYLTQIDQDFECDVFFPQISTEKFIDISDHTMDVTAEMQKEGDITYRYKVFENKHWWLVVKMLREHLYTQTFVNWQKYPKHFELCLGIGFIVSKN